MLRQAVACRIFQVLIQLRSNILLSTCLYNSMIIVYAELEQVENSRSSTAVQISITKSINDPNPRFVCVILELLCR